MVANTNLSAIAELEERADAEHRAQWRELVNRIVDGEAFPFDELFLSLRQLDKSSDDLRAGIDIVRRRRELAAVIATEGRFTAGHDRMRRIHAEATAAFETATNASDAAAIETAKNASDAAERYLTWAADSLETYNAIDFGLSWTVARAFDDLLTVTLFPELTDELRRLRTKRDELAWTLDGVEAADRNFGSIQQPSWQQTDDHEKRQTAITNLRGEIAQLDIDAAAIHDELMAV